MNTTTLTDEQIETFNETGYIILEAAFSAEEITRMRHEADQILELMINSSVCNKRRAGRLDLCGLGDDQLMVRKVQPVNDLSLYLAEASRDERLIGPMRQLMGDEPVLMEEKLNYKQRLQGTFEGLATSRTDSRFPIHSDWAYYKEQDYPQAIISSAISMDDCTVDKGPIHVWPGTHKSYLEHEPMDLGLEVKPGLVDRNGGHDILAPAGSVMLFHSLLIHNSHDNETDQPRRLMIYSHYPKAANKGIDVRNGPGRLAESPWEWDYARARMDGRFSDVFSAP
jgi:ectoine hydroxylase-related dioxygenase (phytanoyl-CoA dioxygenase family)